MISAIDILSEFREEKMNIVQMQKGNLYKMTKFCKDCEHFRIQQEPSPYQYDAGIAVCKKYKVEVPFFDRRKLKKLTCIWEEQEG